MCVRGLCFPLELWWSIYSLAVTRMCLSDGGRGIYSTCIRDLSLFSVERTLSRCDVRDNPFSCGGWGGILKFFQVGSSVVVAMGFSGGVA